MSKKVTSKVEEIADILTGNTEPISESKKKSLANLKPFPKGVSGNPKGRPKSSAFDSAIRKFLDEHPELEEDINSLWPHAISLAKEGDTELLKFLVERGAGKTAPSDEELEASKSPTVVVVRDLPQPKRIDTKQIAPQFGMEDIVERKV